MAEDLETIKRIKEKLKDSPMYNLSLSSKELFHSNFLAWLGNNKGTRQFFVAVIKELTGIELDFNGKWEVAREDKNFDLCIREAIKKEKKGKEVIVGYRYILVIENKVKSIPRKPQLDEYVKKIDDLKGNKENTNDTKFLLLTLVDEFSHKDDINKENKEKGGCWQIKTYNDLAVSLKDNIKFFEEFTYFKFLINDYIDFIENMGKLVAFWKKDNDVFAKPADLDGLEKISDLRAKIQFSSYCEKLKKEIRNISGIVVFDNNDVKDKEFAKKFDKNKLYIYVDWGYSSRGKTGLIDIAIPVTEHGPSVKLNYGCYKPEYVIKIQVEGHSYRHVIEIFKNQNKLDIFALGKGSPYTDDLGWFKDPERVSNVNYGNKDLFEDGLYPQSENSLKNKANWPFKSYTSTFIYQSKTINENAKVDDVLKNIVGEVERVLGRLSK